MASMSPSIQDQVRGEYDSQASTYNTLLKLPFGILESQLFASAVGGNLYKDATVLDLGGGTGLRARQVLEAGAAQVDVVDFSAEMMAVGKKEAEAVLGPDRSTRLRWFQGDVSKPLFGEDGIAGLRESYDLVMANWIFDHVGSVAVLEAMWRNIAAGMGPGGRFIGVRACDPRSASMTTGKYGPTCQDVAEIPGGLTWSSTIPADPPVVLSNSSLETSYSGSSAMLEKHGFCNIEIEPCENADVVRADPEFWELWLEQPGFAVVKAQKQV